MSTTPANWDAGRYHQVARPHAAWGATMLERLRLTGDERVLDAGCGSGRVTAQLLERLPRGHVVASDQSPAMLTEARRTLATWVLLRRTGRPGSRLAAGDPLLRWQSGAITAAVPRCH
jgi:tRNA A58 N-methylase Trm61